MGNFSDLYVQETVSIIDALGRGAIERAAQGIAAVRERGGRPFILDLDGSAAHASHAVNEFRKLCGVEAYAPTENVSELTARTNDEGRDTTFNRWLQVSRLGADALLVFSGGGGDQESNSSGRWESVR